MSALDEDVNLRSGWEVDLDLSPWVAGVVTLHVLAIGSQGTLDLGSKRVRVTDDGEINSARSDARMQISLDLPASGEVAADGTVFVAGWASGGAAEIDYISVVVDGAEVGRARTNVYRADVAEAMGTPESCFAGFEYYWPCGTLTGPVEIRVHAFDVAGNACASEARRVSLAELKSVESAPALGFVQLLERAAPRTSAAEATRARVLVATHSLELGGGQLWLNDLIDRLQREPDLDFSVLAKSDGPLRVDLERLGIPVHITTGIIDSDPARYEGRIQELELLLLRGAYDVLLCNTIDTFFVADAAQRLDIPVVWAVHEHFRLEQWWPFRDRPAHGGHAFARLEQSLRSAWAIVFEADATRALYTEMLGLSNGRTIHYGIDTDRVDRYRAEHDREQTRHELGIRPDSRVLVCIGTVEPRKAQAGLVSVFRRLSTRHDDLVLLMVGGTSSPYTQAVERLIEDLPGARVISVTPDVFRYYHAADLLISASDIESMPRSFMEAMAFETPIISTDVAGCPELVTEGETGWLAAPNNSRDLEAAVDRALMDSRLWPQMGHTARQRLERDFSSRRHSEEIAELLRTAAHTKPVAPGARGRDEIPPRNEP